MDNKSEAIKEADVSKELDELCNLMMRIEDGPDGDGKLAQIKTFAVELLPDEDADEEEAKQAAEEIAAAFITLEKWSAYLPDQLYRDLMDGFGSWTNDAQWDRNPRLAPQMLPEVLKDIILHGPS